MDRQLHERWADGGGTTLRERANQMVVRILEEHRPPELPKEMVQKIEAVTQRTAERQS